MSDEARKWLELAEMDWRAACKCRGGDTDGAVCFHCQQCIEKFIKGCLIARSIRPPHIHDLEHLSELLKAHEPTWRPADEELRFLSRGATEMRYTLDTSFAGEADQAMEICERYRSQLIKILIAGR